MCMYSYLIYIFLDRNYCFIILIIVDLYPFRYASYTGVISHREGVHACDPLEGNIVYLMSNIYLTRAHCYN